MTEESKNKLRHMVGNTTSIVEIYVDGDMDDKDTRPEVHMIFEGDDEEIFIHDMCYCSEFMDDRFESSEYLPDVGFRWETLEMASKGCGYDRGELIYDRGKWFIDFDKDMGLTKDIKSKLIGILSVINNVKEIMIKDFTDDINAKPRVVVIFNDDMMESSCGDLENYIDYMNSQFANGSNKKKVSYFWHLESEGFQDYLFNYLTVYTASKWLFDYEGGEI